MTAGAASDAAFLAALPTLAFAFVLVLARVGAAVMLLPGLGEADLPAIARAGVAVTLCLLLLPSLQPMMPALPPDPGRLAATVGAEVVTGLWFGTLARLVALALPMAGQLISPMIGLSSVLQTDPALGAQTTALSRLAALAAPVLLLASGLYAVPIRALAGSYTVLPAGLAMPSGDAASIVQAAVADSFALAFQLAAPFVAASLVFQAALGLVSRLVPRLQIYFAALPGQVLGGLALLGALAGGMIAAWQSSVTDAFARLPGLG